MLYYRHLSALIFMEINFACKFLRIEECIPLDSLYICRKERQYTFCIYVVRKPKNLQTQTSRLFKRRAETDRRLRLRTPAYYASLTTNKIALKQNQRTIQRYAVLLSALAGIA